MSEIQGQATKPEQILDQIIAEAMSFSEYNDNTDDAFILIAKRAKHAKGMITERLSEQREAFYKVKCEGCRDGDDIRQLDNGKWEHYGGKNAHWSCNNSDIRNMKP